MKHRYLVTCMPDTDTARIIYEDVLKQLIPDTDRFKVISYLDFPSRGEFDRSIRNWIHLSNGIIAIVSEKAHNVFYEVGVAVGFGKPVILLAPNLDEVPTMLRAHNVTLFKTKSPNSEYVKTKVKQALAATLHGTFTDQRFQDHTAVLINQSESPPFTDNKPTSEESEQANLDSLEIGINYYTLKKYYQAITHLELAIESGERGAETYFYLADGYFLFAESLRPGEKQRNAYQKMQYFAREGVKFYPNDKRLRKTKGLSFMKLGDYDRAEKIFNELLQEDPEYIVAAYNLACLYALQHKRSHCLHHLSEVFNKNAEWRYLARFDPDFDNVWKNDLVQRVMFPSDSL